MVSKKIFYFGGQKSGKTKLALHHTLKLAKNKKPFYIATYHNIYNDKAMQYKINKHIKERNNQFITIEEPKKLSKVIQSNQTYIIDCISMWIFNNLNKNQKWFLKELKKLFQINANIIFVLNEVNLGIIPINKQSRKFIDISGIVGQYLAKHSNTTYNIKFGKKIKLKE